MRPRALTGVALASLLAATAAAETYRGIEVACHAKVAESAPVPRGHPAYRFVRAGDGFVCV